MPPAPARGGSTRGGRGDTSIADDTFDAVLSQLVVNFMRDPEAGVREMARVARPGSVVASCVWDYAGEMTLYASSGTPPARSTPAPLPRTKPLSCRGAPSRAGGLWGAAGLGDVRFGQLVVSATYEDFEDLWSPLPTGVGPAGAFCKSLDADRRDGLHDAYRRHLGSDGPFELTARAWAVMGARTNQVDSRTRSGKRRVASRRKRRD